MPATHPMSNPQPATVPMLHRFLGIGITLLAVVFIVMTALGFAPLLATDDETTPMFGYGLSGIAIVLAVVALLVYKPRVPERRPGQTVEQFWTDADAVQTIMPVWFLLEGAATLSAIGFLMSGEPVALLTTGLAIIAFWMTGPNAFAKP